MSYCRMNGTDSDVYVIASRYGWECVACSLAGDRYGLIVGSRERMLIHLELHRSKGHQVPAHAIERLEREIQEQDVKSPRG